MKEPLEVAVLIPCFNEAATVRQVIDSFRSTRDDLSIYVYDNGSTDDTASIASTAGASLTAPITRKSV